MGTVIEIGITMKREEQDELFRYTSGHWLYNDSQQRAERYVKFDVTKGGWHALLWALSYVSISSSWLKFENSAQVIVRIPCPLAGPPHLNTASEVATLEFLRTELGIPVPRVLAWNSRANSDPVGAEYIIMECVPGVSLHSPWSQLAGGTEVFPLLHGLFAIESKLAECSFSQIGSLYFKEDVSVELQQRPLFLHQGSDKDHSRTAEKYRIGPLVDRQWWRGERGSMALDRGPWPDIGSYLMAAAYSQKAWVKQYANLEMPFCRHNQHAALSDHIAALDVCASVAPLIVPPPDLCQPTLWHPDLSLSNIIVSPTGLAKIQGLIDWQGAWTGPYCMQATFPMAIAYEGGIIQIPEGSDRPALPNDLNQRLAMRHKAYEYIMAKDPRRIAACGVPHLNELCMLPYYVLRSWSDGLLMVQESLLSLSRQWDDITPLGTSCPIQISADKQEVHQQEFAKFRQYQGSFDVLHKLVGAEGDGWVSNEHFDETRKAVRRLAGEWDDETRGVPFKDNMYSFFLS
ncbi:hypothetical protein K439DRAFT_1613343 [Ramaria rubella]|nr:hypothetical protein K439DRAFT_1613343 [Ramaria rubella]